MQTSSSVFHIAKQIKRGKNNPEPEFVELGRWLNEQFGVNFINGDVYYYQEMSDPVRLRLIFENIADVERLPKLWNTRLDTIGAKFTSIVSENNLQKYNDFDFKKLSVDYFLFDELAFTESIERIQLATIEEEFKQYNLWEIDRFHTQITVFYLTQTDVLRFKDSGTSEEIETRIRQLVRQNDEFGIGDGKTFQIRFDSKENFDRSGGRYNYYR